VQLEHFERPLNDDPIRHVLVAHGFLGEKQAFESDGFHRDAVEFESFLDALSRLRCCRDEHIDIGGRTSPRCYLNPYFTEVSPIIGNPGKQGLSPNSDRFCYPIVTRIDTQYRSCNYIQFDGRGQAHTGVPTNINPQDRLAARRFASQALDALDAIHDEWIVREKTRPAAAALRLINTHLQLLVTMLDDATADHYLEAHDLGIVVAQLMAVNHEALLKPLFEIALVRQKILRRAQ
jgi:hypothetical protein